MGISSILSYTRLSRDVASRHVRHCVAVSGTVLVDLQASNITNVARATRPKARHVGLTDVQSKFASREDRRPEVREFIQDGLFVT